MSSGPDPLRVINAVPASAPPAEPPSAPALCTILTVDALEVVQYGYRVLFGTQPWVERSIPAASRVEAAELASRFHPQVAVVELVVGEDSGIDIARDLIATCPDMRVILTSETGKPPRSAVGVGFVPKNWSADDFVRAVRMAAMGQTVFSPQRRRGGITLSDREQDVLRGIASGGTNRDIAGTLFISEHTVKQHTHVLYRKLQARNRAEAVQRAQRLGLLE
ncbi:MAG: response regulator transcription factor [Solirubrobacteraceae bacterium]